MPTKQIIEKLKNVQNLQSNMLLDTIKLQAVVDQHSELEQFVANELHVILQECIESLKEVENAKS